MRVDRSLKSIVNATIVKVYSHEGSPGGHNNDRVILTFEDGRRLEINSYSGGNMTVEVRDESRTRSR